MSRHLLAEPVGPVLPDCQVRDTRVLAPGSPPAEEEQVRLPRARRRRVPPPAAMRLLDGGVVLLGVVVIALALARALTGEELDPHPVHRAGLGLAVPLTAFLGLRSLQLSRSGGAAQVALDSSVLVLLGWTVPPATALLVWLVGVTVGQLLARDRRAATRSFNIGLSALAGAALLAVVTALGGDLATFGPADLTALLLGTAAYLAVDLGLTAMSVAWAAREPLLAALTDESTPLAALAVLVANMVGLLAGVLVLDSPWAAALLVPVLLAPLYTARAGAAANLERLRTAALFDAAALTQSARDRTDLERAVLAAAARVTGSPAAEFSERAPGPDQLGARVGASPEAVWLVVTERPAGNAFSAEDASALQVLAALAGQALERLELLQVMSRQASSDALTGLANRRELQSALTAAIEAGEQAPETGVRPGLVYLDLDGFKQVNDVHGHEAGDELLVAIAKRLAASVREGDLVARWGGDEFVVLLPQTDADQAAGAAERLRAAVTGEVALTETAGVVVGMSASVGVALHAPGVTPRALLAAADARMYAAKQRLSPP